MFLPSRAKCLFLNFTIIGMVGLNVKTPLFGKNVNKD
jgi:hypothetical protein